MCTSARRKVGLAAAMVGTLFLNASLAKCENLSDLLGKSFTTNVIDGETKNNHTFRVKIGTKISNQVVDFVLTISPPFPNDYGVPARYVGKGNIECVKGSDDWCLFRNDVPGKNGNGTVSSPNNLINTGLNQLLSISIGGRPQNEFSAGGGLNIRVWNAREFRVNQDLRSEEGGWAKE
jgi:hypothetical protein